MKLQNHNHCRTSSSFIFCNIFLFGIYFACSNSPFQCKGYEPNPFEPTYQAPSLTNVIHLEASDGAFAALLADGSVATWGKEEDGADSTSGFFFGDCYGIVIFGKFFATLPQILGAPERWEAAFFFRRDLSRPLSAGVYILSFFWGVELFFFW